MSSFWLILKQQWTIEEIYIFSNSNPLEWRVIHKFSTGPPNDNSCKVTIQLALWFLTRIFKKFQPMRTHYGPWQPFWISNQHQKQKSGRGPSNEHFWQVWFNSHQRFQRRFKCEKLTDGRQTLTHDKSSHGPWPGELKKKTIYFLVWYELIWAAFLVKILVFCCCWKNKNFENYVLFTQ